MFDLGTFPQTNLQVEWYAPGSLEGAANVAGTNIVSFLHNPSGMGIQYIQYCSLQSDGLFLLAGGNPGFEPSESYAQPRLLMPLPMQNGTYRTHTIHNDAVYPGWVGGPDSARYHTIMTDQYDVEGEGMLHIGSDMYSVFYMTQLHQELDSVFYLSNGTWSLQSVETQEYTSRQWVDVTNGIVVLSAFLIPGGEGAPDYHYQFLKPGTLVLRAPSLLHEVVRPYPNPANSVVYIPVKGTQATAVRLLNRDGRVLRNETVLGSQVQIDVNGLAAGVYFVQVDGKTHRMVVAH